MVGKGFSLRLWGALLLLLLCPGSLVVRGAEDGPPGEVALAVAGGEPIDMLAPRLSSLAVDLGGYLWIGSEYTGVFAFKEGRYRLFDQYNTPMPDAGISGLCVAADNTKWFVSRRGWLYAFDNVGWRVFLIHEQARLQHVVEDKQGKIWLGGQGIARLDPALGEQARAELIQLPPRPDGDPQRGISEVTSLVVDRHGNVWIGLRDGLLKYADERLTWVKPHHLPPGEFRAIATRSDIDELYVATSQGVFIHRMGRFAPVRAMELPPIVELRAFADGRFALSTRGTIVYGDAAETHLAGEESTIRGDLVQDVLLGERGQIWAAGHNDGLHHFDAHAWSVSGGSRRDREFLPLLLRQAWQRKMPAERLAQEAVDVDLLKVLEDPAKYANQKLRFRGTIVSGHEFAQIITADGQKTGIWPNSMSLCERMATPLRGKRGEAKPPCEICGFLEWGGYYGHVGGWKYQLTVVEAYPVDTDEPTRAALRREQLAKLEAEESQIPILAKTDLPADRELRAKLAGVWREVRTVRGSRTTNGPRASWVVTADEVTVVTPGSRARCAYKIDGARDPAWIDLPFGDSSVRRAMGLAVFRVEGDRLTICWNELQPARPAAVAEPAADGQCLIELVRDASGAPLETTLDAGPADDPLVVRALNEARAGLTLDPRGRAIEVRLSNNSPDEAPKNVDELLALLPRLPHLESVRLFRVIATERGMVELGRCTGLLSLYLNGQEDITDAALAQLAGLTRLEVLDVSGTSLSDAGLAHFARCERLQQLHAGNTALTAAGLAHLKGCAMLGLLALSGSKINDRGLENLGSFPELHTLYLGSTGLGDEGLLTIGRLTKLTTLDASHTQVTDAGLAHLAGLAELRVLMLGGCQVQGRGLERLGGLEELNLVKTQVDDRALSALGQLARLRSLLLDETRVRGAALRALATLTEIETLSLNGLEIASGDLAALREMKRLVRLSIEGVGIDNEAIDHLRNLPALKYVGLTNPPVDRDTAMELLKALPAIKQVSLRDGNSTLVLGR